MDRNYLTIGLFIDLRKMTLWDLILSSRSQFVSLSNIKSHKKGIVCGKPQGVVLGPVLFNLYINDIVNVLNKFKYVLFADDTKILYSNR